MIGMNIRILRKKNKISQELLAERLNVSRQTIAKWENDESIPDIHKCKMLAQIFQVTLDQLIRDMSEAEVKGLGPKGKQFFGVVTVGERGQIVIPNEALEIYHIQVGDKLVVLGDDSVQGLAFIKREGFLEFADMIRNFEPTREEEPE